MKSAKLISGFLLGLTLLASPAFAQHDVQRLNTEGIARAIGKQGDLTGEMYKVSFPRSDLTVNVGNVVIKPALALMAWAAFIKSGNNAVTYGDLVVLEDEVNPVIAHVDRIPVDQIGNIDPNREAQWGQDEDGPIDQGQ